MKPHRKAIFSNQSQETHSGTEKGKGICVKEKEKERPDPKTKKPFLKSGVRPSRLHRQKPKDPKPTAIFSLNDDLLRIIYEPLPIIDKVCLSLSCKRLFDLFGTIGKHEDLSFSRLLHLRVPILCVNSNHVPRNKLLLKLENRRWLYCGDCLKLHPRKEFPRSALKDTWASLHRSCSSNAGIVDLCPCISLTMRDCERIVALLKSSSTKSGTKYGLLEFQRGTGTGKGQESGSLHIGTSRFFHRCTYLGSSGSEINCSFHLYIEKRHGLKAQFEYTMPAASNLESLPSHEFLLICPHMSMDLLACISTKKPLHSCAKCEASVQIPKETSKEKSPLKKMIKFHVSRTLGLPSRRSMLSRKKRDKWRQSRRLNRQLFEEIPKDWNVLENRQIHRSWEGDYIRAQRRWQRQLEEANQQKIARRKEMLELSLEILSVTALLLSALGDMDC